MATQFAVEGANTDTGEMQELLIEADDAAQAEQIARIRGLYISSIKPYCEVATNVSPANAQRSTPPRQTDSRPVPSLVQYPLAGNTGNFRIGPLFWAVAVTAALMIWLIRPRLAIDSGAPIDASVSNTTERTDALPDPTDDFGKRPDDASDDTLEIAMARSSLEGEKVALERAHKLQRAEPFAYMEEIQQIRSMMIRELPENGTVADWIRARIATNEAMRQAGASESARAQMESEWSDYQSSSDTVHREETTKLMNEWQVKVEAANNVWTDLSKQLNRSPPASYPANLEKAKLARQTYDQLEADMQDAHKVLKAKQDEEDRAKYRELEQKYGVK